jgi:predicted acetyltransferase
MLASEIRKYRSTWHTPEGFEVYLRELHAQALPETPRPGHFVPSTTLWYIDGSEYLGRLAIRHYLNERLLEFGGHIGYDVAPGARRRGYATQMLAQGLPLAYRLGIEKALLTCKPTNVPSRRVIESNGGVLEDEREGTLRYWVPTRPA